MPKHVPRTAVKILLIAALFLLPFFYRSCASVPASLSPANTAAHTALSYLLQSEGDRLIVTASDGSRTEISDIDPRTLPPYDQDALLKGIHVENSTALEEILQDFS